MRFFLSHTLSRLTLPLSLRRDVHPGGPLRCGLFHPQCCKPRKNADAGSSLDFSLERSSNCRARRGKLRAFLAIFFKRATLATLKVATLAELATAQRATFFSPTDTPHFYTKSYEQPRPYSLGFQRHKRQRQRAQRKEWLGWRVYGGMQASTRRSVTSSRRAMRSGGWSTWFESHNRSSTTNFG